MKKIVPFLVLICLLSGIAVINSCKKDPVIPTLTTINVSDITINSVTTGGEITSDGGAVVTARGVCWSGGPGPDISDSHTSDNTGTGSFVSNITNLTPNTKYYIRAYATNEVGTAYGNEVSFTTIPIVVATLTTTEISSITLTTAITGGNITSDGFGAITARGTCWATTTSPTVANDTTLDGTGTGSFVSNLEGLLPGTIYYVRSYATNSAGTGYGSEVSFTTGQILLPTLTTNSTTSITLTTAVSGGNITADGGGSVTARGVCWATTTNPTTANSKTTDGTGTGAFTSNLTGLTPGTPYYVRAYATNSAGTAYGDEETFTTSPVLLATLTTTAVSSITQTTASSGGNITADGGGEVTARGVCWATTANPTTANSKTTNATGTGAFTSNLTGLTLGTPYHVRAYATNNAGTAYGNDILFTTGPVVVPTLTTNAITSITATTAVTGGDITSDGAGAITAKGVCWATTINPTTASFKTTDGTGSADFTSNITGLTAGTIYYVRAYATNSAGTSYGNEHTFTSLATAVPNLTTTAITSITLTSAVSGGNITLAGAGTISTRGVCWSTTPNPTTSNSKTTDGIGTGSFTSNITGLTHGTRYYVRAYATNNFGTGYGNERTFDSKLGDVEGNTYDIVTIGTQVWMKQNLKTSKYNNGNNIGTTTSLDITGEVTPKYQWAYGDNEANVATFGRLYTFYAVTDARGVCPTGWHAPSETEWTTLKNYLDINGFGFGGSGDDIGKSLASTSGWDADPTPGNIGNDQASNNLSGFTALPGGFRAGNSGTWNSLNQKGFWGTTTVGDDAPIPPPNVSSAWYHALNYNFSILGANDFGPYNGYSIRCIKN